MTEDVWIVCPECLGKFDGKKAEFVLVNGIDIPRCPYCGCLRFLRVADDSEGTVKDEEIPNDPLPDGGENPVSIEL